jgi:hypothetical protein
MLSVRACHTVLYLLHVSPLQGHHSRATSSDTATSSSTRTSTNTTAASTCTDEAPYLLLMHDDPTVTGQLRSVFLLPYSTYLPAWLRCLLLGCSLRAVYATVRTGQFGETTCLRTFVC